MPAVIDKDWLVEQFGSARSPGWSGTILTDTGEQVFSRTGSPVCLCWGNVDEVVAHLGNDRVARTGYYCREGSEARMSIHAEGHDLALVDGRYLVDGWLAHVVEDGPCVLDLHEPRDLAIARIIHEDFEAWSNPPGFLNAEEIA